MITDIKAAAAQVTPVVTGEGDMGYPKMTKLGALFTSDWKQQLLLAGKIFQARVGTVTAGGAPAGVTGGGNSTTINSDQPELVIGVDSGYYMIPLDVKCQIRGDCDADTEILEIVLFADRTQAPVTTNASGTVHAPVNMLDGAGDFPGRCWIQSTGDITDPVTSQILDYVAFQLSSVDTTGVVPHPIVRMDYEPEVPTILAGPCQVVLCWGGSAAATGIGIVSVAVVPASYFPVS